MTLSLYKSKTVISMVKDLVVEDWHRADIIAAVRKTGTNIQQLSQKMGYRRTTLGNALYVPCPKYERLIAEYLGVTPQTIWPSRYCSDGSAKSGRGERRIGRYNIKENIPRTQKYVSHIRQYVNYYQPYDIWALAHNEPDVGVLGAILTAYRGRRSVPFSAQERAWIQLLAPHTSHALGLTNWLRDVNLRLAAAHATLNRLNTGIILLDEDEKLVLANHTAIRILEQGDGLHLMPLDNVGSRLVATTAAQNMEISTAIATALNPGISGVPHYSQAIRVERSSGRWPIILSISTLSEVNEFGLDSSRAYVMILMTDTAEPVKINTRLLQSLYRLSAAELRVVEQICNGERIQTIAQHNNLSEATVKTQLQSVFTKTGVNRQIQLVKLVLSLSSEM